MCGVVGVVGIMEGIHDGDCRWGRGSSIGDVSSDRVFGIHSGGLMVATLGFWRAGLGQWGPRGGGGT